jgi:hypothetical protein
MGVSFKMGERDKSIIVKDRNRGQVNDGDSPQRKKL